MPFINWGNFSSYPFEQKNKHLDARSAEKVALE
jgi:hypothetical protein